MKRHFYISAMAVLLAVVMLATPVFAAGVRLDPADDSEDSAAVTNPENTENTDATAPSEAAAEFSCHTYDTQGHILNGFWSDKDQMWYLFVTSTQEIGDVQVHFTGKVITASAGVLDAENAVVTEAFVSVGDLLELTEENGTVHRIRVLQSSLPSVYVDLEGTTLEDIHADKDKKHKNNSIYIMDPEGIWDLTVENSLEIKGRGNSTWREYDKKAYQIKFNDKTDVMGLGEAKKWVLLANASDDSMMRTQLISQMAENMDMAYVASFRYVDLWIDGEYLGTYLLGEKVEPGDSRLNLTNDAGALFEHDEDFYLDEDYWFLSKALNRHFVLKEIVEEEDEIIQSAMTDFELSVDELALYLYTTPPEEVTLEELSTMIDVDSFIKYYLINEYALNRESFSTSFYWYKDGPDDVIHLGPIWDFDTCMGNDGEPNTESYGENHVLFRYLLASPEFYARTMELWELYHDDLEAMTDNVDVIREEIGASAEMNYIRWDVLGKPNPKGGADFAPTFDAAADNLETWLEGRETGFRVVRSKVATSVVSEDCSQMTIHFRDDVDYEKIMIAVWSWEDGTDDMGWYPAEQNLDGSWTCTVDLGNHNSAGIFYFNVYTDDQTTILATGRNYVETATTARYHLQAYLSEDGTELHIRLQDNTQSLTAVRFDVWGSTAQDTTFKRVGAELGEPGQWTVTIPVCAFNLMSPDNLVIRAFGSNDQSDIFLNQRLVEVREVQPHTYEGDTCTVCGHIYGALDTIAKTPMYRMYNPNSGEHFYTGSELERDFLVEAGWHYEGIAWHAPIFSGEPVYRMLNPNSGDHHYTMSWEEVEMLMEATWIYEGVSWNSPAEGSVQYRLYNPNADIGSHHYTNSEVERDYLVSLGWRLEGIGWYGIA